MELLLSIRGLLAGCVEDVQLTERLTGCSVKETNAQKLNIKLRMSVK